jgi:hypothetical protein
MLIKIFDQVFLITIILHYDNTSTFLSQILPFIYLFRKIFKTLLTHIYHVDYKRFKYKNMCFVRTILLCLFIFLIK